MESRVSLSHMIKPSQSIDFPGEAIAEAIFMTLVEFSMEGKVLGILADTTAPNFGQWRGAITILQVELFIIMMCRRFQI